MRQREPVAGVRVLDHTADLALEVSADSLSALFERAALGMLFLIEEEDEDERREAEGEKGAGAPDRGAPAPPSPPNAGAHSLELRAPDLPSLLVSWLREVLHLHQVAGAAFEGAEFAELTERGLRARVQTGAVAASAVRELKGVTYHDLEVSRRGPGWLARVVFDV